ncbi:Homeobox domain [Castilleja foliolosa]|uniref:Homeobox domain n=1 Tax=Castilleja foliolosa TaxID=1961234 RepID=A0ABD3C2B3_9LAMI
MADHGRAPEPKLTYCIPEPEPEPPVEIIPVKTRWNPKPEQILMLESIFNNGMVNPSKEETTSIRILLENYGQLADANIFYWFQNRRSKCRRQIQARRRAIQDAETGGRGGQTIQFADYMSVGSGNKSMSNGTLYTGSGSGSQSYMAGSSSSVHDTSEDFISFFSPSSGLAQEYEQSPNMCSAAAAAATYGLNYQPAGVIVFINGIMIQIGREPLNLRTMFEGDFLMYHCSGMPIHVNDDGSVMQNLKHGESYFVVEHP